MKKLTKRVLTNLKRAAVKKEDYLKALVYQNLISNFEHLTIGYGLDPDNREDDLQEIVTAVIDYTQDGIIEDVYAEGGIIIEIKRALK